MLKLKWQGAKVKAIARIHCYNVKLALNIEK